jgi:hypothetical protein
LALERRRSILAFLKAVQRGVLKACSDVLELIARKIPIGAPASEPKFDVPLLDRAHDIAECGDVGFLCSHRERDADHKAQQSSARQPSYSSSLRLAGHYFSARAASSTSSVWPSTFTLRQMSRMTPLPSIRKVARSTPIYFLPYMLFSTQTP